MLKKIFIAFAVLALFSSHAFSQEGRKKVLLIVQSRTDDRFGFSMALWRGMELQKAGLDVRAVFQGEAVVYFLGKDGFGAYLKPERTMAILGASRAAEAAVLISTECLGGVVEGMICQKTLVDGVYVSSMVPNLAILPERPHMFSLPAGKGEKPVRISGAAGEAGWRLLADFTAAKIPFTLCALSATQLGVYSGLKAKGLPLSEDPSVPVDSASFLNDGYQIIKY